MRCCCAEVRRRCSRRGTRTLGTTVIQCVAKSVCKRATACLSARWNFPLNQPARSKSWPNCPTHRVRWFLISSLPSQIRQNRTAGTWNASADKSKTCVMSCRSESVGEPSPSPRRRRSRSLIRESSECLLESPSWNNRRKRPGDSRNILSKNSPPCARSKLGATRNGNSITNNSWPNGRSENTPGSNKPTPGPLSRSNGRTNCCRSPMLGSSWRRNLSNANPNCKPQRRAGRLNAKNCERLDSNKLTFKKLIESNRRKNWHRSRMHACNWRRNLSNGKPI